MEAAPLKLDPTAYGIYIPEEDVLTRNKYQWFAVMPAEQLLGTDMIVVKYLNEALEYTTLFQGDLRGCGDAQTIELGVLLRTKNQEPRTMKTKKPRGGAEPY